MGREHDLRREGIKEAGGNKNAKKQVSSSCKGGIARNVGRNKAL